MDKYECPMCGSKEFAIERIDRHLNVICRNCNVWVGELNQNALERLGER